LFLQQKICIIPAKYKQPGEDLKESINILFTSSGGELAPHVIQNLKSYPRKKVRVIAIDTNDNAVGLHFADAFHKAPKGNTAEYEEFIKQIIIQEDINLLIPASDEEAASFSKLKKSFETKDVQFACVDYETLKVISSKELTYKALEKFDIPCANWKKANNQEETQSSCRDLLKEFEEIVIKPSISRGGRDVFVIRNELTEPISYEGGRELHLSYDDFLKEHLPTLENKYPLIIMERLFGPVHDLDLLAKNGEPIHIIARKRINSMYPNAGHTIVSDERLIEIGKKIIKNFNLSWLYDCDLMFDGSGSPKVIEINPRMSGSTSVSIEAGVPLLHGVIDLFLGNPIEHVQPPINTKVVPYKCLKRIS
jgi:carbamoyl-phosphate synthase large subunit